MLVADFIINISTFHENINYTIFINVYVNMSEVLKRFLNYNKFIFIYILWENFWNHSYLKEIDYIIGVIFNCLFFVEIVKILMN